MLAAAFDKGGAKRVTRLYRRDDLPEDQCWLRAPGWCLAFMALMPAALAVAPEGIAAGGVWIATRADGRIAGVVELA